jgi:hypothetical protein
VLQPPPAQILWINMLTLGLPGVAFGGEPLDPEAMHRPFRPPRESVPGGGLAGRAVSKQSPEPCHFAGLGMNVPVTW